MFKPVMSMLQQREDFVETSLSEAASTKQEAEEILAQYRRMMESADQKSARPIKKLRTC